MRTKGRMEIAVQVDVLRCNHCGRLGVAINGRRITAHKCAGSWTYAHSERVMPSEIHKAFVKMLNASIAEGLEQIRVLEVETGLEHTMQLMLDEGGEVQLTVYPVAMKGVEVV